MSKQLKKIMTDLAAGRITKKETELLIKGKKVIESKSEQEFKGKKKKIQTKITKSDKEEKENRE